MNETLPVERGWTDSGRSLDDLDQTTWWETFGEQVDIEKLDPTVLAFLQRAWNGFSQADPPHLFHRFLGGLAPPGLMFNNAMYADDEDDSNKCRYITLYTGNKALGKSHPLGLVYDQRAHKAMQHISMADISITMNGRQVWLHFEVILEAFLDMIDQGKVLAVNDTYQGEQQRTAPWIMPSFTDGDFRDTLQAFEALVESIEYQIPHFDKSWPAKYGLFNSAWISIMPENSFARKFLENARVPHFKYLAPGLQLAQRQIFDSTSVEEGRLRPVLLFENDRKAHRETSRAPWGQEMPIAPFHPDFNPRDDFPAGLYLTETEPNSIHPFEDGCKLVLPFPVGENGWARTSDDALFGETIISKGPTARPNPRSTLIYQQGFNHFIEMHDVQLKHVLARWTEMVTTGKWEVDSQGVTGGIEKWGDSDTGDEWQLYQLPIHW
ncbi:Hypothetical protein R9X50_00210400 [Acrodontium crateriforme]|uniref:Uncharacterized protein n=1 Tax=Acrodontium crateriforme TaxID=150365 RepID=A0AAQ3M076_9PEZI|nr:Hypothetical protein R9X50_00210400 [Acrodontium crateriforme]